MVVDCILPEESIVEEVEYSAELSSFIGLDGLTGDAEVKSAASAVE